MQTMIPLWLIIPIIIISTIFGAVLGIIGFVKGTKPTHS